METWMIVTIALVALAILAIAVAGWTMTRRRRSDRLREGFGPEYEREVNRLGRGKAEGELQARQARVEQLKIRELTREQAAGYANEWDTVQTRFVDDPGDSVSQADDLVGRVMLQRGYPVGEFDQRVADISVDHPDVASNYRAAHDIATRNETGSATTEDLRQAMVHYRALFQDLLPADAAASGARGRQSNQ